MSKENHYKSANYFKQNNLSSTAEGVIHNVVIVTEGVDKDLGYFTPEFLDALVAHSNAQPKGVKCRFGHPNMCKTTLGSYVGRYKNFRKEENKVLADLHLAEIAKETQVEGRGISMWNYILGMAEEDSEAFGNSIHFTGGISNEEKEIDGEDRFVDVYQFESLIASDLVDSPAATDNLFKDSNDLGLMVTNFLDENPSIFKAIEDNPNIIKEFFNKYKFYQKERKMSILKQVKKSLGISKDIDLTLANGDIVSVITENETPQAGDAVVDADGNALADGEHLLPDGGKMVVAEGKISEMKEPETEGDDPDDENKAIAEIKSTMQGIVKENKELKDAVVLLTETVTTLQKSVKSSFKVDKGEGGQSVYKQENADDFVLRRCKNFLPYSAGHKRRATSGCVRAFGVCNQER